MDWGAYSMGEYIDMFSLYYYPENNFFTDEDGKIIYELFDIITPFDLDTFIYNKTDMYVDHLSYPEVLVELLYKEN